LAIRSAKWRVALCPAHRANTRSGDAAPKDGPSEAPAPENSKTQRHHKVIVPARRSRIEGRAARPYAAHHCREFLFQDFPVANAGDAQRIVAQFGGDRLDKLALAQRPSPNGAPQAANRDRHRRRLGGVRQGPGYRGGDQPVYRRLGQAGREDAGKGAVVRRVEHNRRPVVASNRRCYVSYVFERRLKREVFDVDHPDCIGRLGPDARQNAMRFGWRPTADQARLRGDEPAVLPCRAKEWYSPQCDVAGANVIRDNRRRDCDFNLGNKRLLDWRFRIFCRGRMQLFLRAADATSTVASFPQNPATTAWGDAIEDNLTRDVVDLNLEISGLAVRRPDLASAG
jgi:hypothetical protein